MTDVQGNGGDLDLNAFVASIEARRSELEAKIAAKTQERVAVNAEIKELRQELGRVERMWRSTQPRRSK